MTSRILERLFTFGTSKAEHPPAGTETSPPNPITVFVVSWGRPTYLWACLDSLFRLTQFPIRVILLDNAHPDPRMNEVIDAFERRGLFTEVIRFPTNTRKNLQSAYRERLDGIGPLHVFLESDTVICERTGCWLAEMRNIMEKNPEIGMLGSLIDTRDFLDPKTALQLAEGDSAAAEFQAKLRSPERGFINEPDWADPRREFFYVEEPCPIRNPPARLTMLQTDRMQEFGLELDVVQARLFREHGMRPALTARVRHRHLSLLNGYDYPNYDHTHREVFFKGSRAPTQSGTN